MAFSIDGTNIEAVKIPRYGHNPIMLKLKRQYFFPLYLIENGAANPFLSIADELPSYRL